MNSDWILFLHQINALQTRLQDSQKFIQTVRGHFEHAQNELREQLVSSDEVNPFNFS